MTKDELKKELTRFNAWKDRHRFDENLEDYTEDVEYYIEQCVDKGQSLPIDSFSQHSKLLAFAKEMQNIGFNSMDDAEKVVDIYLKANYG
jgi:hypothetical protein